MLSIISQTEEKEGRWKETINDNTKSPTRMKAEKRRCQTIEEHGRYGHYLCQISSWDHANFKWIPDLCLPCERNKGDHPTVSVKCDLNLHFQMVHFFLPIVS